MDKETRVLVVEDNDATQQNFKKFIERAGPQVDTASTKSEAIEKIRCRTYHVVLIDVMLTEDTFDRGGIDVLKYLNSLHEGTQAIIASATSDVRVPVEAWNEGALKYLIKKDIQSSKDLIAKVEEALSNCRLRFYGKFETLTAYLAGHGEAIYYEGELVNIMNIGMDTIYPTFSMIFTPLLPVLRIKGATRGLQIDREKRMAWGMLWSKALGHPLWINVGHRDGEYIEPQNVSEAEILKETVKGRWKSKTWKVMARRSEFNDTLYDI